LTGPPHRFGRTCTDRDIDPVTNRKGTTMTVSAATDPWATSDHDPLSITEPITTAATKTIVAKSVSGPVIAEYPDFTPGTPARVLPAIVSNALPTDRPIIDDN
jgi:hypothetical protein